MYSLPSSGVSGQNQLDNCYLCKNSTICTAASVIQMVPLSLGRLHLFIHRYNVIIQSEIFHYYSTPNLPNLSLPFVFQNPGTYTRFFKRGIMSVTGSMQFNKILGTSISAANRAGVMVRDVMKGGDLEIVEKTGADDLQVKLLAMHS